MSQKIESALLADCPNLSLIPNPFMEFNGNYIRTTCTLNDKTYLERCRRVCAQLIETIAVVESSTADPNEYTRCNWSCVNPLCGEILCKDHCQCTFMIQLYAGIKSKRVSFTPYIFDSLFLIPASGRTS